MSTRKSLPGWLSRNSHSSNKSQESRVLNSDSDEISDNEANPLWYKDFENHSVRRSTRFSLAQTDTPILKSDSEPSTTPLQKSWWKHVPNTPYREANESNVSAEKRNTQERSNVELSDVSSVDERIRKPRPTTRRKKRKSIGTSEFAKILDISENSVTLEKSIQRKSNAEKQDTVSTPSDSDVSIERVRKQPFKKKKTRPVLSFNVGSSSDESHPDNYQDALESSEPAKQPQSDVITGNRSASSQQNRDVSLPGSAKNVSRELEDLSLKKRRIVRDDSQDDSIGDNDVDGSISPVLTPQLKRRTKFTERTKRKTPNFDEILNNASTDESSTSRESAGKEDSSTQDSDFPTHILARDSEKSITRQRISLTSKEQKSRQEKSFTQDIASPNTSVRSEPFKTTRKQTAELHLSKQKIPYSDVERRSSKRKSILAEENQSAKKLSRLSSNSNKFGTEKQSTDETLDQEKTSRRSNIELEDNGNKSSAKRQSTSRRNTKSAEISHYSDGELEDDQSVTTSSSLSGVGDKFGAKVPSVSKRNDSAEISFHSTVELEDNQSVSVRTRPSSVGNKSRTGTRSTNEKNDHVEISNHPQVNESRSSTQAKDTSRDIPNISSNEKILASINEDENERNISTNIVDLPDSVSVINETQNDQQYSNDSRSRLLAANTVDMQTTVLMDLANKTAAQTKTVSSMNLGPSTSRTLEKEFTALPRISRNTAGEKSTSFATDGLENTGIRGSEVTGIGTIPSSAINSTERSFVSPDHTRAESTHAGQSQSLNAEEESQLKIALEEVRRKGLGVGIGGGNGKIDSYFKRVKSTKPTVAAAAEASQKVTKTMKPAGNKKESAPRIPNKAYLVNGKVYKRPPLPRPKSWATNRLYQYLWKKMDPKYKLKTRVRSEKFLIDLSNVVALVVRRKKYENYVEEVEKLIHEMARLGIIKTRNDFHIFCRDFLPYDFRIKVIPMILPGGVRNIPFEPDKLHTPILEQ